MRLFLDKMHELDRRGVAYTISLASYAGIVVKDMPVRAFDSTCIYLDDGTYTAITHIIQAEIHEH